MPFAVDEASDESEAGAEGPDLPERTRDEGGVRYARFRERQTALGNGYLAAAEAPTTPVERKAAVARARETRDAAAASHEPEYARSVRIDPAPSSARAPEVPSPEAESTAATLEGEAGEDQQQSAAQAEEGAAQLEEAESETETEGEPEEGADVLGELEKEEEAAAEEEGKKEEAGAGAAGGEAAPAVPPGVAASQVAVAKLSTAAAGLTESTQRQVAFAPHAEETSHTREVAARGAAKRRASEAIADDFIARNAHHTASLLTLAYTAPTRIFAAAEVAKASVDAAVAQNIASVTGAIAGALASAQAQAAGAKAVIEAQRGMTVATITVATISARVEIEALYTQTVATLDTMETSQKTAIGDAYRTWQPRLEAVGTEIGGEGKAIAQSMAANWLSQRNGESSLLDGPIHDNRLEAKADAAKSVAESYQTEFEKASREQAGQVIAGEADAQTYVTDSATQARDGLTSHRDEIVEALETSETSSLEQANQLADQMLQSIDSSLATTTASLHEQQVVQVARLIEYGVSQKTAIDDQAGQGVAALLEGGAQAVDGFSQSIREFLDGAVGMSAPESDELSPVLGEVQAQVDGLAATMLSQMEQGIAASEQGILDGGLQAAESINQIGQSAVDQAQAAASGFVESVASMLQQALDGLTQLRDGHNETAEAVKASASEGFAQAEQGLRDAFAELSRNTNDNLSAAREQMRTGMRESLPQLRTTIDEEAKKAAAAVQPRWKSVLKWVITIVVIVAVVALTILSAGALGVVGTILLGAALGAAAGAVTTIGHNLVDGKKWSDGVVNAMIVGAIGGAFGGLGGAIAGKVASVGLKFALETGVDVIGGIVGDLAVGNSITLQGVLFGAAIGAGVGAGVGIAGALKGKIRIRPARSVSVSTPTPHVSAGPSAPAAPKSRTRSFLERTHVLAKTPDVAAAPRAPRAAPEPPRPPRGAGEAPAPKPAAANGPTPEAPPTARSTSPESPTTPRASPSEAAPKTASEPAAPKTTPEPAGPPAKAAEHSTKVVTDEPGVAARRKTSDGHEITVTSDGRIRRCTECNFDPYKQVLDADPAMARRADDVKSRMTSDDPDVRATAAKEFDDLSEELERRLKASADPTTAPSKASPDDAPSSAPKAAEDGVPPKQSPDAAARTSGDELAKKAGYPNAEPGYHWANVDGVPVYKRNPNNHGPRKAYDPATNSFRTVGGVDITKRPYGDSGKVDPCFVAGTVVKTPFGDRPIEQMRPGDSVWSYDTESGQVVVQHVVSVYRNWTDHLAIVQAGSDPILSTRRHRYWVENLGAWIAAADLESEMELRTLSGQPHTCSGVIVVSRRETTFNLHTSVVQNFFVGDIGLLVHNVSAFESTDKILTRIYEIVDTRTNKVVYVGKTFQGDAGDVFSRFKQHVATKEDWQKMRQFLDPRLAKQGTWSTFETAVWEQHFMDKHGGPKKAGGTQLMNDIRAITEQKYNKFRDPKYGHNPCP
jgi:hypothetical protein